MAAGGSFTYRWPRPAVTVDAVVLCPCGGDAADGPDRLEMLCIQRGGEPFKGSWALPGGFVDPDEPLEDAAARELVEETHVQGLKHMQIGAFGGTGRDPRGHTVTVAFLSFIDESDKASAAAGDDAAKAEWFALDAMKPMAFDHAEVVSTTLERVAHEAASASPNPAFAALLPSSITASAKAKVASLARDGLAALASQRAAWRERTAAAKAAKAAAAAKE